VTSSGTTTTTTYVGNLEAVSTSGSTTTKTYYFSGGTLLGESVNGTVTYRAATGLAHGSGRTLAIWRRKLTQQWSRFIL
jgi:hypothetical protein